MMSALVRTKQPAGRRSAGNGTSLGLDMVSTDNNEVRGVGLDSQSRCIHYKSELDIIAIRMMCCGQYFACKDCHAALVNHPPELWPRDRWQEHAVLCGVCRHELTISEYMACENICPGCGSAFNPGCRNHYHFYFAS
jgi:uncharacterized CHY-type Zn-finger protein